MTLISTSGFLNLSILTLGKNSTLSQMLTDFLNNFSPARCSHLIDTVSLQKALFTILCRQLVQGEKKSGKTSEDYDHRPIAIFHCQ